MKGREFAPQGAAWDAAVARWKQLPSDPGAKYDTLVTLDADKYRTDDHLRHAPGHGRCRSRRRCRRPRISARAPSGKPSKKPWLTWAWKVGTRSSARRWTWCSSVLHQLGASAICGSRRSVLKGRHVAAGVRALIVPGSQEVKRQAEAEGLDRIFTDAGAGEWREAGCSMCIAMNGDQLSPGQYAVSTSNRNFEGRQGKGRDAPSSLHPARPWPPPSPAK